MKHNVRPAPPVAAGMLIISLLVGCGPLSAPATKLPTVQELAGTMVAATMAALHPTATATPPATFTPLATPTVKPTVFIKTDNAKCMDGPGENYKVIATLEASSQADMIARNSAAGYLMLKDPATGNSCWVSAQDATPGGSFDLLPEITAVAPTSEPASRPGDLYYYFDCTTAEINVKISWAASTGTVNGYRVYRDENKIADLDAKVLEYKQTIPYTFGTDLKYAVSAYNSGGESPARTRTFHCPP